MQVGKWQFYLILFITFLLFLFKAQNHTVCLLYVLSFVLFCITIL